MGRAAIVYRRNENPVRWLAVMGIFFIKAVLAVPHFILLNALGMLAQWGAYIGYFVVAFSGTLPSGLQTFVAWWIRWYARTFGWYLGIEDRYPPFEPDPPGYGVDAVLPANDSPHRGWAIAGIFLIKFVLAIPHLVLLAILTVITGVVSWLGFFAVAFAGRLPAGIQDFAAGTMQWAVRVAAWISGLTDEYPPFELRAEPTDDTA